MGDMSEIVDLSGSQIVCFVSGAGDTPDAANPATPRHATPLFNSSVDHELVSPTLHHSGSSSSIPDNAFDS